MAESDSETPIRVTALVIPPAIFSRIVCVCLVYLSEARYTAET